MISKADILNGAILIVDDKEANIQLLEGMLRVAGYTSVTSTTDPLSVRWLHQRNHYSLILLDLQMPGMDGFEVMEGLREQEEDGYLPVIVITAQPNHKLRALQAGARDFVSKPFDMAELQARVRNAMEVRLLHGEMKRCNRELEAAIVELEVSREVIRLKNLEEQRRSEEEMTLAQQTQESLLPRLLPRFDGFQVHAYSQPTRYVGGDFYDFQQLASGELVGIVADVSGKGIPAALLSSMVLGALSMEFRAGNSLAQALQRVNLLLCDKSLPYQFVTLFLFLLDPQGWGQFISAGHNPAYLFRAAGGGVEKLASDTHFLGMFSFASYVPRPFHLDEGDILIVYSDGLTDAQSQREEVFGEKRLLDLIRREAPLGSDALRRSILWAVDEFTSGTPQNDDITFLIVEKCGG